MRSASLAVVAAFTIAIAPAVALGDGDIDPQARAQAEALFQEGSDLLEAGKPADACPKLQAAVALTRGEALGGKLVLARCYERLGRIASAWGLYREVAARAAQSGQSDRAAEAKARAEDLGGRLHYLELVIPVDVAADPTLEIAVDERVQPRASLSERLAVDPGERTIRIGAKGRRARTQTVVIPAEPGVTRVELDSPPVEQTAPRPDQPVRSGSFWSPLRIAGLTVGIVGAAGAAAGAIVGGLAKSQYEDALVDGRCTGSPPVCDDASGIRDARTLGDVGTATFFAGLGVAAVGVVIFAVAPIEDAGTISVSAGLGSISALVRF